MKSSLVSLIVLIASVGLAQQPATSPRPLQHCYLDAQNVSNYDEVVSHWESGWGSYDRTQQHRLALKLRVGTTESSAGRVKVEWFWIGRKMMNNALVVYGHGSKDVDIPRGYFTEEYAIAPQLNQRDTNYVWIGLREVTGARHEGWVVRIIGEGGRQLAAKASSEPMLKLFSDWAQFSKLLPPDIKN